MVTALEAVERYLVPHRIAKLMTSAASQELLGFHRTLRSRAPSERGGLSAGSEGENAPRAPLPALRTRGNPKAIPQNVL